MEDDVFRKDYRQLSEQEEVELTSIKDLAEDLYRGFDTASAHGADPRCMEEARKRLEESIMWASKAITA